MFNFNDFRADFLHGNINPYAILKKSAQTNYRQREYSNMFMNSLSSMFEYEKSEEYKYIDDRTIELTLILNGINGFCRTDEGKVICGFAYDGGRLDYNGIGDNVSIYTLNGECYQKLRGVSDVVVGINNNTRSADYDIFRYADILSEVGLSEENNIKFTRINPIYQAKNNKIKTLIKEALGKLKNGEVMIVADDSTSLADKELIKQTSITDNVAIDKLQYLSTYYNAVLRRWYTTYGHALSEGMKQAQQSVAEVSSTDSASFIIPLDRLKHRQEMCKALENTFGGSIKVKFSKAWEDRYKMITKEVDVNADSNQGIL